MQDKLVLVLAGKMGVGKSTIAKMLASRLPVSTEITGFGAALKLDVGKAINQLPCVSDVSNSSLLYTVEGKATPIHFSIEQFWEYACPGEPFPADFPGKPVNAVPTFRTLLQFWGEYCRSIDSEHWEKRTVQVINDFFLGSTEPSIVLVDDLRRDHELHYLHEHFANVLSFYITPYPGYGYEVGFSSHISENGIQHPELFSETLAPGYGELVTATIHILNHLGENA